MRSPVNGTAPTFAPDRPASLLTDRLRRLARRMVLFAAAVGAGFLLAALFQGPAAASGMGSGSGAEPDLRIGGLLEPVTRLTEAARPGHDRQRGAGADHRSGSTAAPPSRTIGGVVVPRDTTPTPGSRRPPAGSVPPAGVHPSGAAEHERPARVTSTRAVHRPARRAHRTPPPADPVRQPALAAPGRPATHGPAATPTPDLLPHVVDAASPALPQAVTVVSAALPQVVTVVSAALPETVDLVSAALPHVVDVVRAVPVRPVVMALCQVIHVVLAPALDAVIGPVAPARPPPRALGQVRVPVADPPPAPTMPPRSAPAGLPADPVVTPVRATVVSPPTAPPGTPVVEPDSPGPGASTVRLAALPAPAPAPAPATTEVGLPGRPVPPTDQNAAGVDDRSPPAPGLVRPTDRQSPASVGQPGDLVPLLVGSRAPAPIARPG